MDFIILRNFWWDMLLAIYEWQMIHISYHIVSLSELFERIQKLNPAQEVVMADPMIYSKINQGSSDVGRTSPIHLKKRITLPWTKCHARILCKWHIHRCLNMIEYTDVSIMYWDICVFCWPSHIPRIVIVIINMHTIPEVYNRVTQSFSHWIVQWHYWT